MTETYKLTDTLPYLLYTVSHHLAESFTRELRQHDLTISMYRVLAGLRERESLKLSELADMLFIETSTLSRLVGAMSARGLVSRRRQKDDERSLRLNLSPAGRRLVDSLIPRARLYENVAVEAMSPTGVTALKRSLVRILAHLRQTRTSVAGCGMGETGQQPPRRKRARPAPPARGLAT